MKNSVRATHTIGMPITLGGSSGIARGYGSP
jgi:hypothetical protein